MKKILTEIHLMMERKDFVYVASEIVKYIIIYQQK